jgi:hypothetical protein
MTNRNYKTILKTITNLKSLVGALAVLLLSATVLATSKSTPGSIEPGLYRAVDVESQSVKAELNMKADGTATFNMEAPGFNKMPEPGCKGVYVVEGKFLKADVACPLEILPQASVTIDISSVNPQSVREPNGALVTVMIEGLTEEPEAFRLKLIE